MNSAEPGSYDALLDAVYAAGVESDRWEDVCQEFGRQLDGRIAWALQAPDTTDVQSFQGFTVNYADGFIDLYKEYYGGINPWTPGLSAMPVGAILTAEEVYPRQELRRTEFYADWVLPQGDILAGVAAMLFKNDKRMLVITSNIRAAEEERLLPEVARLLERIAPHIRRSFALSQRLNTTRFGDRHYLAQLEALPTAVLLLSKTGRPTWCNRAAEALLRNRALRLSPTGTIRSSDQDATRQIYEGLYAIETGAHARLRDIIPMRRADGPCCSAHLVPLPRSPAGRSFIDEILLADEPVAVLTITDAAAHAPLDRKTFETLFSLTPAEAQVACAIARGAALSEVAATNSVSINTARKQLKSVFAKTGTGRQGELAALLNRFPGFRY